MLGELWKNTQIVSYTGIAKAYMDLFRLLENTKNSLWIMQVTVLLQSFVKLLNMRYLIRQCAWGINMCEGVVMFASSTVMNVLDKHNC